MLIETITRGTIGKGYRYNQAQELFERYPTLESVEFHQRGDGDRARPRPAIAVYVLATSGTWGRSRSVRIHPQDLRAREQATKLAARRAAEERLWTPELRALAAELEGGNCYRLLLSEQHGWHLELIENLHDVGGRFTFLVRTPEEVLRHVKSGQHEAVYHSEQVRP